MLYMGIASTVTPSMVAVSPLARPMAPGTSDSIDSGTTIRVVGVSTNATASGAK